MHGVAPSKPASGPRSAVWPILQGPQTRPKSGAKCGWKSAKYQAGSVPDGVWGVRGRDGTWTGPGLGWWAQGGACPGVGLGWASELGFGIGSGTGTGGCKPVIDVRDLVPDMV